MSRGRPAPLVKFQHIIQLFTVLLTAILISLFFAALVLVGRIQGTARVVKPLDAKKLAQKAGKEHPGGCTKQAVKETFSLTANNAHPLWFFHRWVGILHFQTGWKPFFDDLAGM